MLEDPNERAEVRARAQGVQQGVRCCGRAIGEQGVERRARSGSTHSNGSIIGHGCCSLRAKGGTICEPVRRVEGGGTAAQRAEERRHRRNKGCAKSPAHALADSGGRVAHEVAEVGIGVDVVFGASQLVVEEVRVVLRAVKSAVVQALSARGFQLRLHALLGGAGDVGDLQVRLRVGHHADEVVGVGRGSAHVGEAVVEPCGCWIGAGLVLFARGKVVAEVDGRLRATQLDEDGGGPLCSRPAP